LYGELDVLGQFDELLCLCPENLPVLKRVERNIYLIPLAADPALIGISPVRAFLYVFMPKNPRKDNLVHITSHGVLME